MKLEKWFDRLMLVGVAIILIFVVVRVRQELRLVRRQFERHPQAFQTAAEYFCALDLEGPILLIDRPTIWEENDFEDEQWPEEVTAAVNEIFRRSDCHWIVVEEKGRSGENYCEFQDTLRRKARTETGIVYTPGQADETLKGEVTNGFCNQWTELSDHWLYFERLSYWGLKEAQG